MVFIQKTSTKTKSEFAVKFNTAGNTVIILSSCQLKMRILRFVVHSVLATKYYQASKTRHQIWKNIWSCSTIKFTEQVPPGGVKQRAVSKATASTSAGGSPPPKQQKLDFSAKLVSPPQQVSGEELKKLVRRYVVEEMLHLNTVGLPPIGAISNKIPTTINAVLGITVKNALPLKWVLAKSVVIFMLRRWGCFRMV